MCHPSPCVGPTCRCLGELEWASEDLLQHLLLALLSAAPYQHLADAGRLQQGQGQQQQQQQREEAEAQLGELLRLLSPTLKGCRRLPQRLACLMVAACFRPALFTSP